MLAKLCSLGDTEFMIHDGKNKMQRLGKERVIYLF
jgi:hypothetical protein